MCRTYTCLADTCRQQPQHATRSHVLLPMPTLQSQDKPRKARIGGWSNAKHNPQQPMAIGNLLSFAPCVWHLAVLLVRRFVVLLPKAISRHERCRLPMLPATTDGNRYLTKLCPIRTSPYGATCTILSCSIAKSHQPPQGVGVGVYRHYPQQPMAIGNLLSFAPCAWHLATLLARCFALLLPKATNRHEQ